MAQLCYDTSNPVTGGDATAYPSRCTQRSVVLAAGETTPTGDAVLQPAAASGELTGVVRVDHPAKLTVARVDPCGTTAEPLLPAERLDLGSAIAAQTIGAAYACGSDAESGSIEPGKAADLVVLDRDLFTLEPAAYPEARVLLTLVEGTVVHAASGWG